MPPIIVALEEKTESKKIKSILNRSGFSEVFLTVSGAGAMALADMLEPGLVICGPNFVDMTAECLFDILPKSYKTLLLAPAWHLAERTCEDIVSLQCPFTSHDLISTTELLLGAATYERKKRTGLPKGRSPEEKAVIDEAKALLMNRNNMTEKEAHRYIQKCSMDGSCSFVETAQNILMEKI